MTKKPRTQTTALETIDLASLHDVTGGRISQSQGPDPKVVQTLKSLAETVQQVGGAMNQSKQQKAQEMSGMMQQMMAQKRGG
jgi:hypothetical protein